jgi:hypothetical protein
VSSWPAHAARGSGRNTPLLIVPDRSAPDITAPFPVCTLCTWVASQSGGMRLKYLSASCLVHMHVRREAA